MKILILANDQMIRQNLLKYLNHLDCIVAGAEAASGMYLLQSIARTTPHAIVIALADLDRDSLAVVDYLRANFYDIHLVTVDDPVGTTGLSKLTQQRLRNLALAEPIPTCAHEISGGTRLIFHDQQFDHFTTGAKLKTTQRPLTEQVTRFTDLLHQARNNHQFAQAYFLILETNLVGLEQELSYRWVHLSYKGLAWSRDLAAKYAAVLSHYCAGVQVQYLLRPSAVHPAIDYVAHEMPPEGQYGIELITRQDINSSVQELLFHASQAMFIGQSNLELARECAVWLGLARLLRQAAMSHLALMDDWLQPSGQWLNTAEKKRRHTHRDEGIVGDFWAVRSLLGDGEQLFSVLKTFHEGKTKPSVHEPIPSYREFLIHLSKGGQS